MVVLILNRSGNKPLRFSFFGLFPLPWI